MSMVPPSALGVRIAQEARDLVGTRFRLYGREPSRGLDCVGLVAIALMRARGTSAISVPTGYRLRNSSADRWLHYAQEAALVSVSGQWLPGDVIHSRPSPAQDHLRIAIDSNAFVHAHAGLGKVVLTQGTLDEPILHHWRAT